ncbi:hypothetical protein ACIPF8_07020 [Collimonas sp. NPDC087041]
MAVLSSALGYGLAPRKLPATSQGKEVNFHSSANKSQGLSAVVASQQ